MGDVISVTPENAATTLADLPRAVRLALGFAARLRRGTLDVTLLDGRVLRFGGVEPGPAAAMVLHNYQFAGRLIRGGDIGIAEAYLRGDWDTPDLTQFLYLFCVNHELIQRMLQRQAGGALRPARAALVQPQHQAPGAPQHLRALRHRQRLLFGLARSEHDLLLGAVTRKTRPTSPPRSTTNTAGLRKRSTCSQARGCWRSAAAGAALPNLPPGPLAPGSSA